jgi:transcriptional regulator with XRE-family HTH domain
MAGEGDAGMKAPPLGKIIRQKRLGLGYSQDGLGYLTGMTRSYITKVENDKCVPHLRQIFRIAEVLEVTPWALIYEACLSDPKEMHTDARPASKLVQ